ncbi:MAG: MurR/RpiR family transcriptional regulator [Anaerolineae bacterium]|nr:MurR/RpiR family transcriptional regulator [Anaerolineae bacterium]
MYRERIAQVYNLLSPSYRRIADFLLDHYREAAFMTAAELGEAVDVDTTTVVRCAQRLGYRGYPDLIHDVQAQVKAELQSSYEPLKGDNSPSATWQRSLLRDVENIQQALGLSTDVLEDLIKTLKSARRIVVLGAGYGAYIGEAFATILRDLGLRADYVSSEAMSQAFVLGQLGAEDVVVGIGASVYAGEVAAVLQLAKDRGAKTAGVFGSYASPIARVASLKVFAPSVSGGPYASLTAITAVLVALAQILALGDTESLSNLLSEFQRNYQNIAMQHDREIPDLRDMSDGESGGIG